jgi:hypothetical protein
MQTRKHGAAMPSSSHLVDCSFISEPGLTKREFFAIISLQGILSSTEYISGKNAAELAVSAADLLIIELNKTSCEENLNGEDQDDE